MESITRSLKKIRSSLLFFDLRLLLWIVYVALIVFFTSLIMVENIFYLSMSVRKSILYLTCAFLTISTFSFLIYILLAQKDLIKRHQLSTIALMVGRLIFKKADMLLNAYQLENSEKSSASLELQKSFIYQSQLQLDQFDYNTLLSNDRIYRWKKIAFTALAIVLVLISTTWSHSVSSMYRLAHTDTEFSPPIPFKLISTSQYLGILGGEDAKVEFSTLGKNPDSIYVEFKPLAFQKSKDSLIIKTAYNQGGIYQADLNEVYQNYRYRAYVPSTKFWEPWEEISSKDYSIFVTDRPSISDLTITINSPQYTKLPPRTQKANQSEVEALLGSTIDLELQSNKKLDQADLILDGEKYKMATKNKRSNYSFTMEGDKNFYINLKDERGISNRNPIPFHLKTLTDLHPRMTIIKPAPIIELGGDQLISILMDIEDDFGFSKLQLAYEIHRPAYIEAEPKISMFNIDIPNKEGGQQQIVTNWEIKDFGLMPEDEIHFHFELYDNDQISGPKKQLSDTFIAKIPSLNDLFLSYESQEEEIISTTEESLSSIIKLNDKIKEARLDLLKTEKPDWEQQQKTKESLQKIQEQIENFQKLNDKLNQLNSQGDKHDLFSDEMMNKFRDLQKMVEEILPQEMFQDMEWMKEALDKLDIDDMISALDNISNNLNHIEQELDRFLDIFQRIKAEQKIDEIRKRLEQLVSNQDNLDQQIRSINKRTDPSVFKRLSQEQKINEKEFAKIMKEMNKSIDGIKKFSRKTAQSLEGLSESKDAELSKQYLKETVKNLDRQEPYQAMDASYAGLQSMQSMQSSMNDIFSEFQKQTTREMAKKFRGILRDLLSISKSQELLEAETSEIPVNSPRQNTLANQQQLLQDQLIKTMTKTMELSKETFLVTGEMGQKLGKANAQMGAAKTKLAERNSKGSLSNQSQAMIALNESAKSIIQTINKMQKDGSASGYEEFLKQMENMSTQQKSVNDQGMQLALGQMTPSMQQSIMKRMLSQQRDIQNALKQVMKQFDESGAQGLGDLNEIAKDIDEVIKELNQNKYDRNTMSRQQQILNRMLDSQKSMAQRGVNDERKSKTATQVTSNAPSGLPNDLGQRQTVIMDAMNEALNAGFSREYQSMIRSYFNSLKNIDSFVVTDTSRIR